MKKQVQKIVVPPREERLEQIGDAKPPKMGGITPTKIEVPEVDDLLEKLKNVKKATAPIRALTEFWSFKDNFIFEEGRSHCDINCKCPPCQSGYCSRCTVEALRNAPQDVLRAAAAEYRGVIYQ